jgi:hypothetical protein
MPPRGVTISNQIYLSGSKTRVIMPVQGDESCTYRHQLDVGNLLVGSVSQISEELVRSGNSLMKSSLSIYTTQLRIQQFQTNVKMQYFQMLLLA